MRRSFTSSVAASQKLTASGLYDSMRDNGIDGFYGVPDSLLKDFAMYVSDRHATDEPEKHIIASNEATAVGLACGHFMAKKKPACVYLQNSGLGNTVNPIMSCAHENIYGLPMLLLIGWRGEPGVKDEPQHNFMGAQSEAVLDAMKVKYSVLPDTLEEAQACIAEAYKYMVEKEAPYALLVRKGTFEKYKLQTTLVPPGPTMSRESAIKAVADGLGDDWLSSPPRGCPLVSSTSTVLQFTASRAPLGVISSLSAAWVAAPPSPSGLPSGPPGSRSSALTATAVPSCISVLS